MSHHAHPHAEYEDMLRKEDLAPAACLHHWISVTYSGITLAFTGAWKLQVVSICLAVIHLIDSHGKTFGLEVPRVFALSNGYTQVSFRTIILDSPGVYRKLWNIYEKKDSDFIHDYL